MIVRISNEGQYELNDEDRSALDKLDNEVIEACGAGEEEQFHTRFDRLLDFVRTQGTPVEGDELVGSNMILPPPDISLAEARAEFTGEGLIPG